MLIFVIPTSYPNPDNPVANSFVFDQVKALSVLEDCRIVVLNVQKQPTKKVYKRIDSSIHVVEDEYSAIVRKKCKTFFEKKFPTLNQMLFVNTLQELFDKAIDLYGYPDVIYAHFFRAGFAAIKIRKRKMVPLVVMEHSGELMSFGLSKIEIKTLNFVIENSEKYIATTHNLKRMITYHTGTNSRILVVPNIVDSLFKFVPLKKTNFFLFLSIARLEYDKRVDLLIRAFCNVFRATDRVRLRIGGTGSESANLKQLVHRLKREHQILFLGPLSRENVATEMANCHCFALPSRHETFGLVWREALCVGRPVITTNHGGFSEEDWKKDYGCMIPVDDENAMSQALNYIYEHYDSYDLLKIATENQKMYDSNIIAKKIYTILSNVIKENKQIG